MSRGNYLDIKTIKKHARELRRDQLLSLTAQFTIKQKNMINSETLR